MNTSEQARCQAHAHQAHKAVHGHLNKLVADDDEDKTQNTPDTTLCSAEAMKKVEKKIDFFFATGVKFICTVASNKLWSPRSLVDAVESALM
jgi:hypothetical protein